MNKTIKIAIYSGSIPSTTFIENLIEEVAKYHDVLLFGTKKKQTTYNSKRIKIIETPINQWRNLPLTIIRTLILLLKYPKRVVIAVKEANTYTSFYQKWMRFSRFVPVLLYAPDIFHLQWATKLNRWVFLKRAYNCKIVLSLLGTHINISPKTNKGLALMYKNYFPKVDAFHVISKAVEGEVISFGVKPESVHLIYTAIKQTTINQFKLPEFKTFESINLVSVGRYHWVKGYTYAIQAIKLLLDRGISVTYTIIAPNRPSEELLFLVQELGLQHCIHFKPTMPQEQLFSELKTYDAMLLPSISEGIANVILEAQALGLPVISTNCGGMAEVIVPNKTGWLVPIRNPKAISDAVEDFINTPFEKRNEMLIRAHKYIAKNFVSESIGRLFFELYDELKK